MPKRKLLFLALPICMSLLSACATMSIASSSPSAEHTPLSAQPNAMNSIVADAIVRPANESELRFEIPGTVSEILVQEGDVVEAGAPLARLDDRDLQLAVEQARAALAEARAAYAQLEAGATPEQIAAALARRDQAQAQLAQVQGAVTPSDIAAAEAALRQAKEQRAKLQRGADPEQIAIARARVEQAQANLNAQRDTLSAAKTNAYLVMQQAVEQLTKAQSAYATAQSDWNYVQETGQHPSNPTIVDPQGNKSKNKVNDTQRQQYYDAVIQTQATMQAAEYAVQQAQVQFETARQTEVTGITAAQAQLDEAQANLDTILADADPDQLAAAEAQVAQAQAALDKLRGAERVGQVAAAEASLRAAQATLEQTTATTRAVDLDVALARVSSMEVALLQAEHTATKATLRAPFGGVVGEINLSRGEQVGSAGPAAVIIADTSAWKIETSNLTERHVVQFAVGSSANITFDALPDLTLAGTVSAIKPLGTDKYGDITYTATITPEQWDERLRWLMSATVTIEP